MKKISLKSKLNLNKVTVSELNHLVGGAGEEIDTLDAVDAGKKSRFKWCVKTSKFCFA